MRSVCKFNPLTGESTFITQQESAEIKNRRRKLAKKVIMCSSCRFIVHTSTNQQRRLADRYYERAIQEVSTLQNHRTKIQNDRAVFYCNQCGQSIGSLAENHSYIAMDTNKTKILIEKLAEEPEQSRQIDRVLEEQEITISVYNGLTIASMKRLLVKLMYSKCHRYQTALFAMRSEIQNYLTALNNFIKVINAYKSEGESATKRLITQDLKQSNFSSFQFDDHSKGDSRSLKERRSRSRSKKEQDSFKQDMKVSCMSTTAFQQNTSMNLRSRVSRLLSPIRQTAQ